MYTLFVYNACYLQSTTTQTLAYELRQPLSSILANAQAARHLPGTNPPDAASCIAALEDIANDGRRANAILERFTSPGT